MPIDIDHIDLAAANDAGPAIAATTAPVAVLVPVGALGAGIRDADVQAGLAGAINAIACDAGSTDSGPAYLATGRSKYSRAAV